MTVPCFQFWRVRFTENYGSDRLKVDSIAFLGRSGGAPISVQGEAFSDADGGLTPPPSISGAGAFAGTVPWEVGFGAPILEESDYIVTFSADTTAQKTIGYAGSVDGPWNFITYSTLPIGSIGFIKTQGSYFVGHGSSAGSGTPKKIYKSNNFSNWVEVDSVSASGPIRNFASDDLGQIIAVGGQGDGFIFRRSTDAGETWTTPTVSGITTSLNGAATNKLGAWVVGGNSGRVRYSTDDGQTWLTPAFSFSVNTIFFILHIEGVGFRAFGNSGRVWAANSNSVQTWSLFSSTTHTGIASPRAAYRPAATGETNPVICISSTDGTIWRSTDSGETWVNVASGLSILVGIAYADGVWIATAQGRQLYKSEDDAITWQAITPTPFGNSGNVSGAWSFSVDGKPQGSTLGYKFQHPVTPTHIEITASGASRPKRGIVEYSPDGNSWYELKTLDFS
jgi:hypothetical protein